ncbi:hypothetical protein [Endozoicomonas numazuensis]|uniref:Uncharacterized protein n=1 Tax=Endozoicomonas numazuensis TaxID=1137799 RepID=A0A081NFR2_9GAMM|nr:hypothetical protein [Endozoicomonas numazuensis]KEQ17285.1 hypothetical protein GZ78_15820 [Endozoicomonas numazuensis]
MKISLSQFTQSLFKMSFFKLAMNAWKHWNVRKDESGIETLGKMFRRSSSQESTPPSTPIHDHKVDPWSAMPPKPEVQVGVTYAQRSFDMECALEFFPVPHGAETSSLIGEIRQICGQGTTLEILFSKLNELKDTAEKFQIEVEKNTQNEAFLVVPYYGAHKVVKDTPRNRSYYRLSDKAAEKQKVILKSDRLLACSKIETMIEHLKHELGPGKLEEKLKKLETKSRKNESYRSQDFRKDLGKLSGRALELKAKCAEMVTSEDPRLSSLGNQWMKDLTQIVAQARTLMERELPGG